MIPFALILLILLVPCTVFAQEVQIRSSLTAPVVGGKVSIFLFIDYPHAQDVRLSMPNLGAALQLDRVRTEVRRSVAGMPDKKGPFTAVEMVFIPQRAGTITLAPIEIILPGRSVFSESLSFFIESTQTAPAQPPRFHWESSRQSLAVGEKVELILRVSGAFNGSLRETDLYTAVPEQIICEYRAPTEADREKGIAARLLIIPLSVRTITLASRTVQYEGKSLVIPGFTLPVLPSAAHAAAENAEPAPLPAIPDEALEDSSGYLRQPQSQWYFLIGITLLVLILFFQKSRFQWLFVALCAGIILYSTLMLINAPKTLVLPAVDVYRIPDTAAQITARFDEGQVVTVRSSHEEWLYVEAVDGRAGWIQKQ